MTESQIYPPHAQVTVLALDTSTASLAAAVVRNGTAVATVQSFAERNHSVLVVPEIKRLMEECGVGPDGIDAIAVGRGPGSYTGVRIAVSVGKTLAWTWNKTLIGVSSLEALALGAWEALRENQAEGSAGSVWIVPVMDARRGQVYTCRIAANASGGWERLDADGIRLTAGWSEAVRSEGAGTQGLSAIWFVGETEPHESALLAGTDLSVPVRTLAFAMEGGPVGRLGEARFRRGEKDDIHSFVPNYTQVTEAEAKLQALRPEGLK